jgi:isoleucyl-tRNA synthetase
MNALLHVVELGRSARNASSVKIRQPLPEVLVRVRTEEELSGLKRLEDQLTEELNVKKVTYLDVHADFVTYNLRPNLPLIGKRLGKLVPQMRNYLATADSKAIARNVREGEITVVELEGQTFEFEPEAFLLDALSPEGYSAVEDKGYLAALNTTLTPELIREGLMRDVVRLVQNARKNAGLEVSDFIELSLESDGELQKALEEHKDTIMYEVLAKNVTFGSVSEPLYSEEAEVEGNTLRLSLKKT